MISTAGLIVTAVLATSLAQDATAQGVVVTNPSWKTPPQATEYDYPIFASKIGLSGRAKVECQSNAEGVPHDCHATAIPAGLGFEAKAIDIVTRGRMNPRTIDGQAISSRFAVNIPFSTEPDPVTTHAPWTGPAPTNAQMLAGLVSAQTLGQTRNGPPVTDWGLNELSPDRALVIQDWISAHYVGDSNIHLLSKAIAMVLAARGSPSLPQTTPDDWPQWLQEMQTAMDSIYTPDENYAPLKTRLCALYECGAS